ncbi:MAG: hypothetical protein HPY45_15310 [Anaerolineae bacterium]|nr:hypothetical protein [Anaerolineae bacterium]
MSCLFFAIVPQDVRLRIPRRTQFARVHGHHFAVLRAVLVIMTHAQRYMTDNPAAPKELRCAGRGL